MGRAASPLLFAALLLLAGCAGTPGGSSVSSRTTPQGFDVPGSYSAWKASAGSFWGVMSALDAPSPPKVTQGSGSQPANWILAPGSFGDLHLDVKLNILNQTDPGGAGVIFHFVDAKHYAAVRFSPAEAGWHLLVANGSEPVEKGATRESPRPQLKEWVALRVVVTGHHVQAWQGEQVVVDYDDGGQAPVTGAAGLFTSGFTAAQFDDFDLRP